MGHRPPQVTTDKASDIVNDPNQWHEWADQPQNLTIHLQRLVRVSVETHRIVSGLPAALAGDLEASDLYLCRQADDHTAKAPEQPQPAQPNRCVRVNPPDCRPVMERPVIANPGSVVVCYLISRLSFRPVSGEIGGVGGVLHPTVGCLGRFRS